MHTPNFKGANTGISQAANANALYVDSADLLIRRHYQKTPLGTRILWDEFRLLIEQVLGPNPVPKSWGAIARRISHPTTGLFKRLKVYAPSRIPVDHGRDVPYYLRISP